MVVVVGLLLLLVMEVWILEFRLVVRVGEKERESGGGSVAAMGMQPQATLRLNQFNKVVLISSTKLEFNG